MLDRGITVVDAIHPLDGATPAAPKRIDQHFFCRDVVVQPCEHLRYSTPRDLDSATAAFLSLAEKLESTKRAYHFLLVR